MNGSNAETNAHSNHSIVYPANHKVPVKAHTYAFKPVETQIFANATIVVPNEITKCSNPVE